MEKKDLLGIQKKNKKRRSTMIKRNKKRLIKNVVDYLMSDPYMYAPLVSPSMPDIPASKKFAPFVAGNC
uniref:Uncharacterized protein MANES_14G147800 n=1 Tax=Rhizophora mucronata TaxID=61149 RepID=A0A2P2JPP0_RHIMU